MQKPARLIKGEDLIRNGEYSAFELEIKSANRETRKNESGEEIAGIMIWFTKAEKPFFVPDNGINSRLLRAELGSIDPKQLPGRSVTLIPVVGDWFGDANTLAIRVLVTGNKPRPRISKRSFGKPVIGYRIGSETK